MSDKFPVLMESGASVDPLVSFEHAGSWFHIVRDDGCLVLLNPTGRDGTYRWATHWFPQAIQRMPEAAERLGPSAA